MLYNILYSNIYATNHHHFNIQYYHYAQHFSLEISPILQFNQFKYLKQNIEY